MAHRLYRSVALLLPAACALALTACGATTPDTGTATPGASDVPEDPNVRNPANGAPGQTGMGVSPGPAAPTLDATAATGNADAATGEAGEAPGTRSFPAAGGS